MVSIEVTILLSAISVSAALIFGVYNIRRNNNKDCAESATQSAKIIAKLEGIEQGVSEIKDKVKNVEDSVKIDHDRIIRLEESAKQAHKRIDRVEQQNQITDTI